MCISRSTSSLSGETFHTLDNRVDMIDIRFPCALEVKRAGTASTTAHYFQALKQSLERLEAFSHTRGHIQRVQIFALAPPFCAVILAKSSYSSKGIEWKVSIHSIPPDSMFPMWAALGDYAVARPSWYLHPEAYSLHRVVRKLWSPCFITQTDGEEDEDIPGDSGYLPLCYFSVQVQAQSSSGTVFFIKAPEKERNKKNTDTHKNEHTIAVKVFRESEDYKQEVESLTQMATALKSSLNPPWEPREFYALAHADFK